jgi:hypothetical protein
MTAPPGSPTISPITIITPVRRPWSWWLRRTWPGSDRSAFIKAPILRLSFIHAAHWGLFDRIPATGSDPLPTPYILFQSNFDGRAFEYAEAFALEMPWRIRGLWAGAHGFPGPNPPNRFVRYVLSHAVEGPFHYYARYPTGTVRTVRSALALKESFTRFERKAAGLDADKFAEAWREFLTREQRNL